MSGKQDGFFGLWTVFLLLCTACQPSGDAQVETFTVARGEFINSVTVTGELDAVQSRMIAAPSISWRFGALKITRLVDDGKQVEAGEVLIEFDKAEVEKQIADANGELEIARAELRKARANHESDVESREIDLEIARLNYRISELGLERATFEAEIDRKKIELDLEQATIDLEKAAQELENKKRVNQEEINKLELKVQQVQAKLDEANETLAKLTVIAPTPGIAIVQRNWMTGAKFQVDEQPYSGWSMVGLPDLSQMKAGVQINEVDISKVRVGQEAAVTLDAFPDTSFSGEVVEISTLARNKDRKSKVKVFDATVRLNNTWEKLLPGMTVSCEVIVERIPDTLFVPIEALFRGDKGTFVYVKNGSGFERKPVAAGVENDNYVILAEGVREGDEVALTDPTAGRPEASEKTAEGAQ